MLNILVMGDTHCGDAGGITHPSDFVPRLSYLQEPLWNWFTKTLQEEGPFDALIGTGDAVDGEGKKENVGLIQNDTLEQAKMAERVYEATQIKKKYLVYGTPYHTVGTYSYETPFAEAMDASIKDEQFLDLNGLKVSVRHAVGSSQTPYGAGTPVYKEAVRDLCNAAESDEEPADLIIRGHIHMAIQMSVGYKTALSAPCLQYPISVFGRKCRSFAYHMGVGVLRVEDKEHWSYTPKLYPYRVLQRRDYTKV